MLAKRNEARSQEISRPVRDDDDVDLGRRHASRSLWASGSSVPAVAWAGAAVSAATMADRASSSRQPRVTPSPGRVCRRCGERERPIWVCEPRAQRLCTRRVGSEQTSRHRSSRPRELGWLRVRRRLREPASFRRRFRPDVRRTGPMWRQAVAPNRSASMRGTQAIALTGGRLSTIRSVRLPPRASPRSSMCRPLQGGRNHVRRVQALAGRSPPSSPPS